MFFSTRCSRCIPSSLDSSLLLGEKIKSLLRPSLTPAWTPARLVGRVESASAVNKDEIQRVCTQESGVGGRVSSVIGFVRAVGLNVAVPSG